MVNPSTKEVFIKQRQSLDINCPWCQALVELLFVHGHQECPNCHRVVEPCCEGSPASAKASDYADKGT